MPRHIVKLTVVDLEHVCPYGRGLGAEKTRKLSDCFMDSATPGHFCTGPVLKDQRCDRVVTRSISSTGWRSYKLVPMDYGEASMSRPGPRLIYTPLNREGTAWMAVNIHTGEKREVDLSASIWDLEKLGTDLVTRRYTIRGECLNDLAGWQHSKKPQPVKECPSCQHTREPGGCYWHRNGLPYPGTYYRSTGEQMVKHNPASVYFPNNKSGTTPGKLRKKVSTKAVVLHDKVTTAADLISSEMKKRKK